MDIEVSADLEYDGGRQLGILNTTTIATPDIAKHPEVQGLARELGRWVDHARGKGQTGGLFDRQLYTPPDAPWDKMRVARRALREDEIVSGVADITQAAAFKGGLKWESANPDVADLFNQLSRDLNLDNFCRAAWREEYAVDQFISARLWGAREYTIRGTTEKSNKRKKRYRVWAPLKLKLLDPAFTVPIGWGPLRDDRLAWQISHHEIGLYEQVFSGLSIDILMQAFFKGMYQPGPDERVRLAQWGVITSQLVEMDPDWVFRHCNTKPDFQLFPDFRLESVFGLLDLKRQLLSADRAALVGAASYILLVRYGSEAAPAKQEEINAIRENYTMLAKLPVVIADHRLDISIVAPKLDFVLKAESYEILDSRILMRCLNAFLPPGVRTFDAPMWTSFIEAAIQDRRHMMKRTLERELAQAIMDHPRNAGIFDDHDRPSLVFTPRNVSIGEDSGVMQALLALRTQREVSRDTVLEYLGLDQSVEAMRVEQEDRLYKDVFDSIRPYASPSAQPGGAQQTPNGTPEPPAVSGARGGRPVGGGQSKKSPAATAKPRTPSGNVSTKASDGSLPDGLGADEPDVWFESSEGGE